MARRRANGEGTIRQRKNGSWQLDLMIGFDKITGKKKIKSFYGRTRKEALAKFELYLIKTDSYLYYMLYCLKTKKDSKSFDFKSFWWR